VEVVAVEVVVAVGAHHLQSGVLQHGPLLEVAHQQPERRRDELLVVVEGEVHQHRNEIILAVARRVELELQHIKHRSKRLLSLLLAPTLILVARPEERTRARAVRVRPHRAAPRHAAPAR